MAKHNFKPIFERSLTEQYGLLKTSIANVQSENLAKGLYNSYRDEHCISKDLVIHEYNNRKELVKIDSITGKTQTIKKIK